jgi:hypothetical protein
VSLRALLRLCRIPNVFTACANVAAALFLTRGGDLQLNDLLLVFASAALYLAGMVLNDFFDRKVDAVERPERPIPSGQVTPVAAALLGFTLLVGGLVLAALHGIGPLSVALALAVSILVYDAWLKSTPLGPVAMGTCRFLNVLLGMSVTWPSGALWLSPVAMGLYTVAITVLSRDEVAGGGVQRTRRVVVGLAALWLFFAVSLALVAGRGTLAVGLICAAPFVTFLSWRGRANFAPLWHSAAGPNIGRAIGGGILLMPAIDASFVAAAGQPVGALVVLSAMLPATLLKRWYYLT